MLVFLLLGVAHATTVTMTMGFYTDDKCENMIPSDSQLAPACEALACETTDDGTGETENACDPDEESEFTFESECTCVKEECSVVVTNVYEDEGDHLLMCTVSNVMVQTMNSLSGLNEDGRRRVQAALRRRAEIDDVCIDVEGMFMGMKFDGCDEVDHEGLAELMMGVGSGEGLEDLVAFQHTDPDAKIFTVTVNMFTDDKCTTAEDDGENDYSMEMGEGCNAMGIMHGDVFIGMEGSMKVEGACDGDTVTVTMYEECDDCSCTPEEVDTATRGGCTSEDEHFESYSWTACAEPERSSESSAGALSIFTAIALAMYSLF